ncbi:MAG: TolC family protein [Acidobacteriota bacterium]
MPDRTACYLFLALLFAPFPARAQSGVTNSGSGQQAAAGAPAVRLSLKDAVGIALAPEGNERVQLAEEMIRQARALSDESRGALLPSLSASVGEQSTTRNLEAAGIHFNLPIPGFTFPTLVGPFNIFDARATASQTILNLGSVRRYQASRAGIRQAEAEEESAQDDIRAQVARAYLAAVRADAVLEATQADVNLAEAVLKLANDQKAAGTGTGIEVTRSGVQLANQKQRLLVAQNERTAAQLQLLRVMHLDLSARLELTDTLAYVPTQSMNVQQALHEALESRADWRVQQKRLETARLLQSAARMDRMPSVNFFADYGAIGTGIDSAVATRTYGVAVQIPIFDGGRVDARRAQSVSLYHQEMIRNEDLRSQIELEVRLALDSLQSAAEQVKTAEEGLGLALNEVAQAERRYRAGASPGLEVTDAQTRLERARENKISALFGYNIARINLAAAMGTIRQVIQ